MENKLTMLKIVQPLSLTSIRTTSFLTPQNKVILTLERDTFSYTAIYIPISNRIPLYIKKTIST